MSQGYTVGKAEVAITAWSAVLGANDSILGLFLPPSLPPLFLSFLLVFLLNKSEKILRKILAEECLGWCAAMARITKKHVKDSSVRNTHLGAGLPRTPSLKQGCANRGKSFGRATSVGLRAGSKQAKEGAEQKSGRFPSPWVPRGVSPSLQWGGARPSWGHTLIPPRPCQRWSLDQATGCKGKRFQGSHAHSLPYQIFITSLCAPDTSAPSRKISVPRRLAPCLGERSPEGHLLPLRRQRSLPLRRSSPLHPEGE